MPNVKITDLVQLLDKQIAELRAGDPSWTPEEKKKAKSTIEMMKAFRLLSEQQCSDAIQSVPGGGGGEPGPDLTRRGARKASRKR